MDKRTKHILRNDLLAFVTKCVFELRNERVERDEYLEIVAGTLSEFASSDIRRLIINLPPRCLKTFIGSVALTAFMLGHNPHLQFMILSYAGTMAETIALFIRDVMRSPWYQEIFPKTRLSTTRFRVDDFRTTAGGKVHSLSLDGSITGKSADVIIIDDPTEISEYGDQEKFAKLHEKFDTEVTSRLSNRRTGRILVIAHRVDTNDLCGHLMRKDKKWHELSIPLVATRNKTYEAGGFVWTRKKGDVLRPDSYTPEEVADIRAQTAEPGFETLYQQDPGRLRGQPIKAKHFPPAFPWAGRGCPCVISIDPAAKAGSRTSLTAILVFRVLDDTYILVDAQRVTAPLHQLIRIVRRTIDQYLPARVLCEDAGFGTPLLDELQSRQANIVRIAQPTKSKIERLRPHRSLIRRGGVMVPREDSRWKREFVREFEDFPHGEFSDQVDATSQFLAWIAHNDLPPPEPPKQRVLAVHPTVPRYHGQQRRTRFADLNDFGNRKRR